MKRILMVLSLVLAACANQDRSHESVPTTDEFAGVDADLACQMAFDGRAKVVNRDGKTYIQSKSGQLFELDPACAEALGYGSTDPSSEGP